MKEGKQEWLFPEVGESIEEYKRHGVGERVSEGEIYPVPTILMDEEARTELPKWPMEISSRRIVITKPFARFAELEPDVLFDARESNGNVSKIEFRMEDTNMLEITFIFKNGKTKLLHLTLKENGQIYQSF